MAIHFGKEKIHSNNTPGGDFKGASTLCRTAECNTLQLCLTAKVARHMPPMRSHPHEKKNFTDLQVTKSVEQNWQTLSDFFSQWLIPFWNHLSYAVRLPVMGPTICRSNF